MLIYNKITSTNVYFIHIPRTGGRYVKKIFEDDDNYFTYFSHYNNYYNKKEIPHLIYPDYLNLNKYIVNYSNKKIDIKTIPHFTVVREPFERFKSEMKHAIKSENDLNLLLEHDENFIKNILNNLRNNEGNWFVPQSCFISPQTKIWRFEDGFGIEFVKWIKKNFNFEIKTENVNYKKLPYDLNKIDLSKLQKLKPIICEIYKEDYYKFEYK